MPREGGASSTPRPIGSTTDVSGILDYPLSRVMTVLCCRLRLLRKFRRRLARDLPERVGKRRHAGIAEVGRQLLDRNIGIDRQPLDGGGNAGALAPALEAQLRFRRKQ